MARLEAAAPTGVTGCSQSSTGAINCVNTGTASATRVISLMDQSAGLIRKKQTSARCPSGGAQRLWGLMPKDLAQAIHDFHRGRNSCRLGTDGCSLDSSQTDATGAGTAGPNHPPVIRSVTLAPIPIVREGVVTATVEAEDLDRDAMTFTFKWIVNDELRPEEVSVHVSSRSVEPRGSRGRRGDSARWEGLGPACS